MMTSQVEHFLLLAQQGFTCKTMQLMLNNKCKAVTIERHQNQVRIAPRDLNRSKFRLISTSSRKKINPPPNLLNYCSVLRTLVWGATTQWSLARLGRIGTCTQALTVARLINFVCSNRTALTNKLPTTKKYHLKSQQFAAPQHQKNTQWHHRVQEKIPAKYEAWTM